MHARPLLWDADASNPSCGPNPTHPSVRRRQPPSQLPPWRQASVSQVVFPVVTRCPSLSRQGSCHATLAPACDTPTLASPITNSMPGGFPYQDALHSGISYHHRSPPQSTSRCMTRQSSFAHASLSSPGWPSSPSRIHVPITGSSPCCCSASSPSPPSSLPQYILYRHCLRHRRESCSWRQGCSLPRRRE